HKDLGPRSTMSCVPVGVPVADDGAEACANCGKHGSDAVKLKDCTACRLVKVKDNFWRFCLALCLAPGG
ncbi:hypothetical protein THAOC_37065, partial [Thalassiosira oceanica]